MSKLKNFTVGLCLVLVLSACEKSSVTNSAITANLDLAQFAETNGIELPISKTPVKLTMATLTDSINEVSNDMLFFSALKELTGIELDVTLTQSKSYPQKLQMMIASKQVPDIFQDSLQPLDRQSLARNNVIVCFDDYADMLPNYKQLYVDNEENRNYRSGVMVDGKLYQVPCYNVSRDINHGFMYRKDIFDKHNIPVWKNSDEFYLALKKLKELYPDSMPFVSKRQLDLIKDFALGWDLTPDYTLDKNTNTYKYTYIQDEYKQVLDYMRKLYKEELIDPEFLTSTEANWAAQITQKDKAFVTFDWIDRMDLFYEQIKEVYPDYDLRFAPPVGPNGGKYYCPSKVADWGVVVHNGDKKELAMKLVDFLLSPAGAKLGTLGVEGVSYTFNEDGKVEYLGVDDGPVNTTALLKKYGMFLHAVYMRMDPRCIYYQYSPKLQEAQDLVRNNSDLCVTYSSIAVIESADNYNRIYSEIDNEHKIMISKYILDQGDTTQIWNDWLVKAQELGVDQLTKLYNKAYKTAKGRD